MRYLAIEWHPLKGLSSAGDDQGHADRMAGLSLRYSIDGLLKRGCSHGGPQLIAHDDPKEPDLTRSYFVHELSHRQGVQPVKRWCLQQGGISARVQGVRGCPAQTKVKGQRWNRP